MPELPEVQAWRKLADQAATGKMIVDAYADKDEIIFDQNDPFQVATDLKNKTLVATHRKGKHFWFKLSDGKDLYIHFGMTGSLHWLENSSQTDPSHIKLDMTLDDGTRLVYRNMRRIGKVRLLDDVTAVAPVSKLGPDPVEDGISLNWLQQKLSSRKAPLKAVLLDQSVFAGVGNWIADEILYQARLDPHIRCTELTPTEIKQLRSCMMKILNKAVQVDANAAKFPKSWLFHYRWGKKAQMDAKGESIRFDQVGGRTTAWVPSRVRKA